MPENISNNTKQIYIDSDLHLKLKLKAVEKEITLSSLIDKILSNYFKNEEVDDNKNE